MGTIWRVPDLSPSSLVFHVDGIRHLGIEEIGNLRLADFGHFGRVAIELLPNGYFDRFQVEVAVGPSSLDIDVRSYFTADDENFWKVLRRRSRLIAKAFDPICEEFGLHGDDSLNHHYSLPPGWILCANYSGSQVERTILVADFAISVARRVELLVNIPDVQIFLCHASEDKDIVDELARYLDASGIDIWYDKREIKAGDSIVEKVGQGLLGATHVAVILSTASVNKPWVARELNSSLMRQLAREAVKVVPVVIEPCSIPPLLADIRYADCTTNRHAGFEDLIRSLH